MSKDRLYNRITLALLALTCLVNIATYRYLPERVGMQITISGELANFVPKPLFLFIAPVILLAVFLASRKPTEKKGANLFVGVIIFLANLGLIIMNL